MRQLLLRGRRELRRRARLDEPSGSRGPRGRLRLSGVDRRLELGQLLVAKLLREHLLRVDAHRLERLHATLAHGSVGHGAARKLVHELLVRHSAVAVGIAVAENQVELIIRQRNVPQVERAANLVARKAARAVEVDVLEGLVHVAETAVQAFLRHCKQALELLLLLELLLVR